MKVLRFILALIRFIFLGEEVPQEVKDQRLSICQTCPMRQDKTSCPDNTTMFTKGYIFNTESDAIQSLMLIIAYFGIPVSPDAVTQTYTEYQQWGDQWAILYDESLEPVLGSPVVLPTIDRTTIDPDI